MSRFYWKDVPRDEEQWVIDHATKRIAGKINYSDGFEAFIETPQVVFLGRYLTMKAAKDAVIAELGES
jgi:hypothetical protein